MTEIRDTEPSPGHETSPHQTAGGHRGLVSGAVVLAGVAAILAGSYGIGAGSIVFKALALEGALVVLAAGLALDAGRIRRRLGEAREWQPRESHGWDEDDEEGDANVTLHDV
ncbi:MAG: hypothetical protein ABIK89_03180, partial [Planctomycetota bacterium]